VPTTTIPMWMVPTNPLAINEVTTPAIIVKEPTTFVVYGHHRSDLGDFVPAVLNRFIIGLTRLHGRKLRPIGPPFAPGKPDLTPLRASDDVNIRACGEGRHYLVGE
jgi:hypothetical protein